jgi:hypothetical protein
MSKNRLIFVLTVLSVLIVSVAVSRPPARSLVSDPAGPSDFFQRHPDWAQTASINKALIPVSGQLAASDYFQRHPEFSRPAAIVVDTSDYILRHTSLLQRTNGVDNSDYFLRHRE